MCTYVYAVKLIKDGCTLSLQFNGGSLFFALNVVPRNGVFMVGNGKCPYEYRYIHKGCIFKYVYN